MVDPDRARSRSIDSSNVEKVTDTDREFDHFVAHQCHLAFSSRGCVTDDLTELADHFPLLSISSTAER